MARKIRKTLKSGGRKLKTRGRNLKSKRRTSKLCGKKINKTKGNKKNRKHLRGGDRYTILTLKEPRDLYEAINMGYNEYYKNNKRILKLRKDPIWPDKDMRNIWTKERKQLLDILNDIKDGKDTYNAIRGQSGMQDLHILDMEHFTLAEEKGLFERYLFKKDGVERGIGEDESATLFEIYLENVTHMINLDPRDENVPYFIGIKQYKGTDPIYDTFDNFTTAKNSAEQRVWLKGKKKLGDLKNKFLGNKSESPNDEKTNPLL